MDRWVAQWGDHLRIQHKVWVMLLLLCVPLGAGIAIHLYVVQQLLALQQQKQDLMLVDQQVHLLGRLAVDIEDGFRGYVLTQQPAFLAPLVEAEAKLDQALSDASSSMAKLSGPPNQLAPIERQLKDLLRSKQELIAANHSIEEIRRFVEADSLGYLSLESLSHAVKDEKNRYCYSCYTGEYPTPIIQIEQPASARS